MNHLKVKQVDNLLLHSSSPRLIESQIIGYIMSLRKMALHTPLFGFLIAPIFTFYQLNDVVLNRKKVNRYLGEYKRVVRDRAYTTEQIRTSPPECGSEDANDSLPISKHRRHVWVHFLH